MQVCKMFVDHDTDSDELDSTVLIRYNRDINVAATRISDDLFIDDITSWVCGGIKFIFNIALPSKRATMYSGDIF